MFRANTINKKTSVFRRLEKIAIKSCKKKNAILLLSIFISKYIEDSILATENKYIFNITKTITIVSIDTILGN